MSEFPNYFPPNGSAGADYPSDDWDLCVLGGVPLPGFAEVTGPGIMLRCDKNAAAGKNGGRPVYHGLEEQRPSIKVIVWTQSQLDELWSIRSKIMPVPGVTPKPVSIRSPWLKMIDVTTVTIIGVSPLRHHASSRVPRGLELTISCSHWLGDSKGVQKNQTTQTRRRVEITDARALQSAAPPEPISVSGTTAPDFQPG